MEIGVLRRIMKRAKTWSIAAEDVKLDRENTGDIAKVLTREEKLTLFETAAMKEEWLVVYCAAVLAVSTTCRGIELKHLRWRDVDLFERCMVIRRSKTQAGHRNIPQTPMHSWHWHACGSGLNSSVRAAPIIMSFPPASKTLWTQLARKRLGVQRGAA